jgi:hypothetical protein
MLNVAPSHACKPAAAPRESVKNIGPLPSTRVISCKDLPVLLAPDRYGALVPRWRREGDGVLDDLAGHHGTPDSYNPRWPEPQKTSVASAGRVGLAAAQNAHPGESANVRVARPVAPSAATPAARQVAGAAVSAFSAPLSPRRPEPQKTSVASAGRAAAPCRRSFHVSTGTSRKRFGRSIGRLRSDGRRETRCSRHRSLCVDKR